MKSILMSIQPKWVEKIISGEKTIEVRKTAPKEVPFKVYIYCTKSNNALAYLMPDKIVRISDKREYGIKYSNKNIVGSTSCGVAKNINGKVIGEFVCDKVDKVINHGSGFSIFNESKAYTNCVANQSGLDFYDLKKYLETKDGYAWHITDLKIYDKPRDLSEYFVYNKELEKRFIDGDDFCCYDATNEYGEAMTECDGENIHNCYRCWEEWSGWCHRITRPPQSWQYVETPDWAEEE